MEYINITQDNLNNFKIFNKGGFEGKIYLYDKDILMKIFEPYLKDIIDIESKQYKLEKIYSKNINEKILLKPIKLVKINDSFSGYLIKKINKKKQIDEIQEIDLLLELYIKLFNNIEILHQNNIVVGDLKPDNIIVDFENNPIFIDIDSMGVDEYKIDNEDYRSINTRTIPNYEEKFKKLNRKEMDKFMLLAAFINSLSNERYISLSKKIFDSNLDLLTKKKLLEFLRENKKIDSDEVIEILKEEQNIRKNR